ncbi:carbamoyltransferase C-terminal domain-containing protein [Variovorax ureilyticus]|uniref:Carbamoyltransferase C-terminal domain-containing protein n=1 Tax=Variovorax ureilyticus TaxID=1836198 RepID=A0ABU8VEH8_9BURK
MEDIKILGINPGHDGAIAYIANGVLEFSFESEKDNGPRYGEVGPRTFLKALEHCSRIPTVIASGGWSAGPDPTGVPIGAGYRGIDPGILSTGRLLGKPVINFSSSHERSHILCAYGLSPFAQGNPCYVLVWEGHIGSFYLVDAQVNVIKLADILTDPGIRYAFLYALADPKFKMHRGAVRLSDAGKLMAIAAYASDTPVPEEGLALVDRILHPSLSANDLFKDDFNFSSYYNCGVTAPKFANLAKLLSDRLYQIFEERIRPLVKDRHPLLISGGCGLNCEWNSRWKASGIFSDVFVPPCTNDSGSAIGTAIDAQLSLTGRAKIQWDVYSGETPIRDLVQCAGFRESIYDAHAVARLLNDGAILGWMQGRHEIGPRSLGARSILAVATSENMLDRLNQVKKRESFRPIAPICLEEKMSDHFYPASPSPYMLEFRRVISKSIPAVTHVDGSARPQSVSARQNARMHELLSATENVSGVPVLCNTSLNFNGSGFLNRLSDLSRFCAQNELDGFVFEDSIFLRANHHGS